MDKELAAKGGEREEMSVKMGDLLVRQLNGLYRAIPQTQESHGPLQTFVRVQDRTEFAK
jgi:hypothetical protein